VLNRGALFLKAELEIWSKVLPIVFMVIYVLSIAFGFSISITNPSYASSIVTPLYEEVKESPMTKLCSNLYDTVRGVSQGNSFYLFNIVSLSRISTTIMSTLIPPYVAYTYFAEGLFLGLLEMESYGVVAMYIPLIIGDMISISLLQGGIFQIIISRFRNKPVGEYTYIIAFAGLIGIIIVSYVSTIASCIIEPYFLETPL